MFYGHLKRGKLTEGLPPIIETGGVLRTCHADDHPDGLSEQDQIESFIERQATNLMRSSGMHAEFTTKEDIKSDKQWGRGKLVPWHMIRFVSYAVRKVVGRTPDADDEGLVVN